MTKKNDECSFGYAYQVTLLMRFVILIYLFFVIYNFRMLRSAAALFIFDLKLVLKKRKLFNHYQLYKITSNENHISVSQPFTT